MIILHYSTLVLMTNRNIATGAASIVKGATATATAACRYYYLSSTPLIASLT